MSKISRSLSELPADGLLRVKEVLTYLPIKKSTWYDGVRRGRFPQPVRLGTRTVAWRAQDIRHLIDHGVEWVN
jgi:predicted DNA-binding transcriptional regulator AlpA